MLEPTDAAGVALARVAAASEAHRKATRTVEEVLERLQAACAVAYRSGITQTRLATLCGISQPTISRWLRDAGEPDRRVRPADAVRAVTRAAHRYAETETTLNRARSRRTVAVHHAIRASIGADSAQLARATGEPASRLIEMRDIAGPADLTLTSPIGHPVVERLGVLLGGQHSVWVEHRGDTVSAVVRIDSTSPIPAEVYRLIDQRRYDRAATVEVAEWSVLNRRAGEE